MYEPEILKRRLDTLIRYVAQVHNFTGSDRKEFVFRGERHHVAVLYFQLAVEVALDLATDLLERSGETAQGEVAPFAALLQAGIIDAPLGERLAVLDHLAHDLAEVNADFDAGLVFDVFERDVDALRDLAGAVIRAT